MPPEDPEARLSRLEEAQMFAERRADLLSEQMEVLEKKLSALQDQLRGIEAGMQRVDSMLQSPPDDQAPPSGTHH
jgi:uncharacterized coiled-coil protein SlyX